MANCHSCGSELLSGRFCSSCGAPSAPGDDVATFDFTPPHLTPASKSPLKPSASRPPSSSGFSLSVGRFLPGSMIAARYRIITLLGKGGMGEVYRADDLTLGQPVALKFLPDHVVQDVVVLERFRNEVRMARRVSHPNVCRVYDVGEIDGATFFTMEYVDGEDLASLLRRIGRLPEDKALAIARQLCAGLAAAHGKGVLHRDMKPANVMLDGRGQVVITDFGLAGIADQIAQAEVRSGTPAYMAPEQLAGQEVSVRSDIYSLGLVLYEVFTGKRAFVAAAGARADRTPSRPSLVVQGLDPAVERVILRCLEKEPSARPATALSVAAALPGADPLAAALAAGETPSPELVAASGETAGLRSSIGMACIAFVVLGLAASVGLSIRNSALERIRLEQPPEVLAQKARETITSLGYAGRPLDTASGFLADRDLQEFVEKNDQPHPQWESVLASRPPLVRYWFRQSQQYMAPTTVSDLLMLSGVASSTDPAPTLSGMINLELDPQGRLLYFQAIPPQKESLAKDPASAQPFLGWNQLFQAAGLDQSQFRMGEPVWNSLAAADTRMAWDGLWPGTQRALHVEAAAWRAKPVFFLLAGDWTKPDRMADQTVSKGKKSSQILVVVMVLALLVFAAYLAWHNYLERRADLQGAVRLAGIMFVLQMLIWLCRGHLVPSIDTFGMFLVALSGGLFVAGLTWTLYLALEPWVRKRWPHALISWSRLISGKWRDPLVGRDILFGVMLGIVWILIFEIRYLQRMHLGGAPEIADLDYLISGRFALGAGLLQVPLSILGTLQFFFLLFGLKVLLRKDWLAAMVFIALFAIPPSLTSSYPVVELPTQILVYAIAVLIVYRFGLVPLAVAIFTIDMLGNIPFTADFSIWYMSTSIIALFSVLALAAWGFYHSLGGEPLWKMEARLG